MKKQLQQYKPTNKETLTAKQKLRKNKKWLTFLIVLTFLTLVIYLLAPLLTVLLIIMAIILVIATIGLILLIPNVRALFNNNSAQDLLDSFRNTTFNIFIALIILLALCIVIRIFKIRKYKKLALSEGLVI